MDLAEYTVVRGVPAAARDNRKSAGGSQENAGGTPENAGVTA